MLVSQCDWRRYRRKGRGCIGVPARASGGCIPTLLFLSLSCCHSSGASSRATVARAGADGKVSQRRRQLTSRTDDTNGGRPSTGTYHLNPQIELILSRPLTIHCRLHQPAPLRHPLTLSAISTSPNPASPSHRNDPPDSPAMNLTLFHRAPGGGPSTSTELQGPIATSGPYSDATSGVRIARRKMETEGVYVLVPSLYDRGSGTGSGSAAGQKGKGRWRVDVWADGPFELERVR